MDLGQLLVTAYILGGMITLTAVVAMNFREVWETIQTILLGMFLVFLIFIGWPLILLLDTNGDI